MKLSVFLSVIFCSGVVSAGSPALKKLTVQTMSHHGTPNILRVAQNKDGSLQIGGKRLSPGRVGENKPLMDRIFKIEKDTKEFCQRGTYQLSLENGKTIQSHKGCLEGSAFLSLNKAYNELKRKAE